MTDASPSPPRVTRRSLTETGREESWDKLSARSSLDPRSSIASRDALNELDTSEARMALMSEHFATHIDSIEDSIQAYEKEGKSTEVASYKATLNVVAAHAGIAGEVVKALENDIPTEDLSRTWRGRIQSVKDQTPRSSKKFDSSVLRTSQSEEAAGREIRNAREELNTWKLFQNLLQVRHPGPASFDPDSSTHEYLKSRGDVHQFTPETDLWERFLLSSSTIREKCMVLRWLEECAGTRDADFAHIIDELEEGAGTGKGTWQHGFLSTRERIKSEKRKRGIDSYLESSNLRTKENTEPLVLQLDPDAPTRQGRCLEKADDYHDRSLWLACFAMTRRGMEWSKIREWFEDRGEGWRAASIGIAVNGQNSRTCLLGPQAGTLYRQMCLAGSRNQSLDVYQRAVYGLLAGDIESVDPVCRGFDDLLYARYHAHVIRDFEAFARSQCPDRFSNDLQQKFPNLVSSVTDDYQNRSSAEFVLGILDHSVSSSDAANPIKLIQASLVGDDVETLAINVGIALAHKANSEGRRSRLIPALDEPYDTRYDCVAGDFDAIRILVHILHIYERLGYEFDGSVRERILENIFVAYVDFLRLQGKIEAIPTYAVMLSDERSMTSLGAAMVDIVDRKEQETLIKLLTKQHVNVAMVLIEQYLFAADLINSEDPEQDVIEKFDLLEPTDDPNWPGMRIRRDFNAPVELTEGEDRMVRSVEWFLHVESRWGETFYGAAFCMRALLVSGHFEGALEVTNRVPFTELSMRKTSSYVGKSVDIFDDEFEIDEEVHLNDLRQLMNNLLKRSSRRHSGEQEDSKFLLEMMRSQSLQYRELQQLCKAIELLRNWKDLEEMVLAANSAVRPGLLKDLSEELQNLDDLMKPLLSGLLTMICEENELPAYTLARRLYLPPTILAYASARVFAAMQLRTPELLLPVLSLAPQVANSAATGTNADLAGDFVASGRMDELVTCLAGASAALIRLNQSVEVEEELGRSLGRKARKARGGRGRQRGREWGGESVEVWDPTRFN